MKTKMTIDSFDWNVIYTQPGMEKKISTILSNKHITNYLPVNKVDAPWWSLKRFTSQPLFPSIIFVKPSPDKIGEIKNIPGVVNFLYWLDKPALIKSHEITTIKVFLNTHKNITIEKTPVDLKYISNIHNLKKIEMDRLVYSADLKVEIPTLGYSLAAKSASSNIRYIRIVKHTDNVELKNCLSNAS